MAKKILLISTLALIIWTAKTNTLGAVAHAIVNPSNTPTASATADPTSSEDKVKILRERLEELVKEQDQGGVLGEARKMGIVGTLSNITTGTLTITDRKSQRHPVATTADTIYLKNGKTVKFEDIQVNDYTIAMGFLNSNNILEVKRVVTTDKPPVRTTRVVVRGTVQETDAAKRLLTVLSDRPAELEGPETFEVIITKKLFPQIPPLEPKNEIILIGIPDNDDPLSLTLRTYKLL